MGMSASQARLLTITSRMHDVEYKAQNIESQKIQLATQKDELYQNYCDALDAKKIQVAYTNDGVRTYIDATFANVCQYDPLRTQQYALKDADTGKVIVDSKVYNLYENQGFSNDKYAFAWAMLGMENNCTWRIGDGDLYASGKEQLIAVGVDTDLSGGENYSLEPQSLAMTDVEKKVFDDVVANGDTHNLQALYEEFDKLDKDTNATKSEKYEALSKFRETLYKHYGQQIYEYMQLDKNDPNNTDKSGKKDPDFYDTWDEISGEFNYYVRLFEEIQNCSGCRCIDDITADTGNEWFNNAITSGQLLIDMYVAKKGWTETSVATSTTNNYLQEVPDEAELKKAEAEYEYELDKINQKDTKFDKELSKLETERNALKTEMDSIKQVKDDNIERTFGIFS